MQIKACAESYSCIFTLYVDDMTFSSEVPFPHKKLSREIYIILRRYGHKLKNSKVRFYSKKKPKLITGTIVTPEHTLDIPNRLQRKIYNNLQEVKQLTKTEDFKQLNKTTQTLLGQIQAAKTIDRKRFPEIERLTKEIRNNHIPLTDRDSNFRYRRKSNGKIHIPNSKQN